jgi:hypothetical protein
MRFALYFYCHTQFLSLLILLLGAECKYQTLVRLLKEILRVYSKNLKIDKNLFLKWIQIKIERNDNGWEKLLPVRLVQREKIYW